MILAGMAPVTVVATVLNEAEDIDALISSLAGQTLVPAEIIIVDGGSTDGTWERLAIAKAEHPNLLAIRDESCNLKRSPGPISRGRNVAIAAGSSDVIACADAGCTYESHWLARLTAPILAGKAEYSLGGSRLDPGNRTLWDVASAPFLGVKLGDEQRDKSVTARSMAFRKSMWSQVGGFPETAFLGEDTLFDVAIRKMASPVFVERAKAFYHPRHTFKSAMRQLASYARNDGVLGIRPARFLRNAARCAVELAALILIPRTVAPLLIVLGLETYFAFRLDWRELRGASPRVLAARWIFSLIVPWGVTWNQIAGTIQKANPPNRQNVDEARGS
jgi:glycosyltransferase involved in cell wall biosynthesis